MVDDDITVISDPSIPNTVKTMNLGVVTPENAVFLEAYIKMMLNPAYPTGQWSRSFQARHIIKTMKHLDELGKALKVG